MGYKRLEIWKLAEELVILIHEMTITKLPKFEMYEEGSQIRKSSKNVKATIVEGYGRKRYKADFIRFLVYSLASNDETIDHLENLYKTKSLQDEVLYSLIHTKLNILGKKINLFISGVEKTEWENRPASNTSNQQPATNNKQQVTDKMSKEITSREKDYSQWYNDLVIKGELADYSAVRGCMIIRPYGFALWEHMRDTLDKMFKDTGHVNAYFPLFIPKSFLSKEAAHVEGFAKECAVVTHYRLKNDPNGSGIIVDPEAKLEEELIVRPTSETIIWSTYKDWIKSYRDLPLLINQWANVVRWEMRTRLFLRTAEFLWQEGHTAHATKEEAVEETEKMLNVYATFVEEYMAIPLVKGVKTPSERFAGAEDTYCIEGLMQDGKALQCGTSHFLGQNFAKAFDVKYLSKENQLEYVWATSWGMSTRMVGAMVMAHGDDQGLIIPPKIAPIHVVIVPIYKGDEQKSQIDTKAKEIIDQLKKLGIRVKYDDNDNNRPGWKFAEYELKGVPVRLALGARDLEKNVVEVARRDTKEKKVVSLDGIADYVNTLLADIQQSMYDKAKAYRDEHITKADSWDEFEKLLDEKGGFISAHWDGTAETEEAIKDKTKATIRCIPLNNPQEDGKCILSGKPSKERVLFARAY